MFGSLVQLAAAVWAHVKYNQDGGTPTVFERQQFLSKQVYE